METPPASSTGVGGHERLSQVLQQLAMEAGFVRPDSDEGLLPLNSLLMEALDCLATAGTPESLRAALAEAHQKIQGVFDRGARFDSATASWFQAWGRWLQTAAASWLERKPVPGWVPPKEPAQPQSTAAPTGFSPSPGSPEVQGEPELLLPPDADATLLREFLAESAEHLQNIEQGVLVLEENPEDADTLNSIFRAFHTFKGGAGFLNLQPVKDLAHELESLLDAARRRELRINRSIIDLILEGADALKAFVREITACLKHLDHATPIVVPTQSVIQKVRHALESAIGHPQPVEANAGVGALRQSAVPRAESLRSDAPGVSSPTDAAHSQGPASTAAAGPASPAHLSTVATGFVKVDTVKLDSLIDLVGELVIAESMVLQDPQLQTLATDSLARNLSQLRRITSELQRTAMSLRMVPIRATFQKMHRLVRDLATRQGKQVQLVLSGEDTELDRNIVEALHDPLVHMIRNAVDHGIEPPEVRQAAGKPPTGTVHLRAFHQGGNIVIQIEDNGRGINKDKLIQKAKAKGLLKPDATLSDTEAYELIFAPGFSTAEQVTEISGRGVGMDVVRKNIEKLRGKIDIESRPGHGTTFTIYLPLTLAIIDGLIVSVGDERYIIPTLAVRESFRPRPEMLATVQGRGEMINVRGRLTPLVRLHALFQQPTRCIHPTEGIVVVVESGPQTRCLLVDALLGKQEVVIKSLGTTVRENPALAGGAVLGDGRVGLILNVDALVKTDTMMTRLHN